jgi:hypothetical protein
LLSTVGPNLSKFFIHQNTWRVSDGNALDVEEVLRGLRPWQQSLREFSFRCPGATWGGEPPLPSSLRNFTALEVLDLHSYALADRIFEWWKEGVFASCLPTSLRKLRIPGYSIDRTPLRGALDAVRPGRLPHLARVEITAQTYQDLLEEEPELWREDKEYVQLAEDLMEQGWLL